VSAPAAPAAQTQRPADRGWRRWLAVGTGVGIEAGARDLRVAVVKLRPSGFSVVDTATIQEYAQRPASEWGSAYAAFLRRNGMARRPAVVLLPRSEVIVRYLALPGVPEKDLGSAISFQIDSLHPYAEQEAAWCWARLPGSANVMIGITRTEVIERFWTLFVEAGISVSSFTFSAAAAYGAIRTISVPPKEFLALAEGEAGVEAYGESAARPVFSGFFESTGVTPRLLSELRLEPDTEPLAAAALLPEPRRAPEGFAISERFGLTCAAMAAANPRLALDANLLPVERRARTSRLIYVPTILLAVILVAAAVTVWLQRSWEDRRFLEGLQRQVAELERQAAQSAVLDKEAEGLRARLELLDRYAKRTKADIDLLKETTALIPPPGWVQTLTLTRVDLTINGEADGAAGLIQVFDKSPLFRDSQFSQPMGRSGQGGETFIIRAVREGEGTGVEPGGDP
jgi:hypothetical protein